MTVVKVDMNKFAKYRFVKPQLNRPHNESRILHENDSRPLPPPPPTTHNHQLNITFMIILVQVTFVRATVVPLLDHKGFFSKIWDPNIFHQNLY